MKYNQVFQVGLFHVILFLLTAVLYREASMAKTMDNVAVRQIRYEDISITLDLSKQILGLEIEKDRDSDGMKRGQVEADLFPTFGEEALLKVHRQAAVLATKPLFDELLDMEALFYGAYLIVAEEIGLEVEPDIVAGSGRGNKADKTSAGEWLRACGDDPDVGADNRMMVPVFYDDGRKKIKVWVVMGYSVKPLSIWFVQEPEAVITDRQGNPVQGELEFKSTKKYLIYPVSAEVYVNKLLNRNEFRTLCDKNKTQSAILEALDKL